jgi:hypothetical protein
MVLLRAFSTSVLAMVSLAACDVGEVPIGGGGGTDGGGSGSAGFATTCETRGTTIGVSHLHTAGGGTNAGQGCLNAGCHGPAQAGGEFSAAGVVYKQDGTTPNPGAIVRIKNGNMTLTAVAEDGGTFHFPPTPMIAYPTITDVSACPNQSVMTTKLTVGGGGNCSQAGCHVNGAQGPIRGLN